MIQLIERRAFIKQAAQTSAAIGINPISLFSMRPLPIFHGLWPIRLCRLSGRAVHACLIRAASSTAESCHRQAELPLGDTEHKWQCRHKSSFLRQIFALKTSALQSRTIERDISLAHSPTSAAFLLDTSVG